MIDGTIGNEAAPLVVGSGNNGPVDQSRVVTVLKVPLKAIKPPWGHFAVVVRERDQRTTGSGDRDIAGHRGAVRVGSNIPKSVVVPYHP